MRGVNKAIIVGRLGSDPDCKTFPNGGAITTISVATSEKWTDKQTGEPKEATEWHRIVFRGRLAEVAAQYLRKGSQVYVEGALKTRKWQDQNNIDRYVTEVVAFTMQMLGGGQGEQGQTYDHAPPAQAHAQAYNQAPPAQTYDHAAPAQAYNQAPPAPAHNQTSYPVPQHQSSVQGPNDYFTNDAPVDDDIPF